MKSKPSLWTCYIKPTNLVHSSKFRIFEVGYCIIGEDNRVSKKVIVARRSDAIHVYGYLAKMPQHNEIDLHMDLTKDGYIRLFSYDSGLSWQSPVMSDAILSTESIDDKLLDQMWQEQQTDVDSYL